MLDDDQVEVQPGGQRAQDRDEDALASAKAALDLAPKLRGLRYNYALALERVGRGGEALEYYERLAKQELDSADLALNYVRALYAAGRKKDAESIAEQAVQLWPGSTALHSTLARMRWLRGEGEKCTAVAEAELLWRRPTDMALRLACADALHRGGHPQKALQALEEALRLAPDSPGLLSARGVILDELERPIDARFDPSGRALYVVDYGVMLVKAKGVFIPFEKTGVLWRITRSPPEAKP